MARIQLVKSGFWDKFKGSLDAGAGYTSATELLQLDFDAELRYTRPRFEAYAKADAVLTQQPEADDTQRSSLTLGYTRIFPNRHRVFAQGTPRAEPRARLRPAQQPVRGLGLCAGARSASNQLVGGAGLSVNREKPVEGESTTNLEATFGLDYANFAYDFPNTDIQVTTFGYLGLNQWGRFRLEASAQPPPRAVLGFLLRLEGLRELRQRPGDARARRRTTGGSASRWAIRSEPAAPGSARSPRAR